MKKMRVLLLIIITAAFLAGAAVAQDPAQPGSVQQSCFIMKGNPINPKIYSDYKGHRIYFCCRDCLRQFEQNPEKYLQAMLEARVPLEKAPEAK